MCVRCDKRYKSDMLNINPAGSNFIEGVGDEVLVTAGILISVFLTIFVTLVKLKRSSIIHPSSQDVIDSTRRQLNLLYSNRFFDPSSELSSENPSELSSENPSELPSGHSNRVLDPRHYGMDNQCPVCLNEPHFPVGML